MILKLLVLVVSFLAGAMSASIDCNTDSCAKSTVVLEELGCKAVFGSKSCCAKRFECPDFQKLNENTCSFKGKEYLIGETLPRSLASNTECVETCFCTRQDNEPAKFVCTNSDCGVSSSKLPGCLNIYGDLNECCSTSIVCDEAEKESLATCFEGGKEYREGEKFISESHKCYECLCHRDFDNTTIANNLHCRKLNCEIDLKYKSFVQRGCLPVFHIDECCPVDWECPKLEKKISKRSIDDENQTAKQDVFIVTPSKNLEGYLAEVKVSNPNDFSTSSEDSTTLNSVSQFTETTSPQVLSTNPLIAPSDVVTVPVSVKTEDETTARSLETLIETTTSASANSEATNAPTTQHETLATTLVTEKSLESNQVATDSSLSSDAISSTTLAVTNSTIGSEETEKSEDSKESEEEGNTNLFGEDVEESDEDDKDSVTTVSTPSEVVSVDEISSSTVTTQVATETTQVGTTESPKVETTETLKEELKVLEKPEELTTLLTESSTVAVTSQATVSLETSTVNDIVTVRTEEASIATTQPSTSTQNTVAASSEAIFPTEFEKLLTTLREFVAKVDLVKATESPNKVDDEASKAKQELGYVNFTVSSEKHEEATRLISKRSVDAVDLIPRYFKHQLLTDKDKVCIFNGRNFRIGEVIKTNNNCIKCLCEYAPFGHCILKEKCN